MNHKQKIEYAIAGLVGQADAQAYLDSQTRQAVARDLTAFVIAAVAKYVRGQAEHGGHIGDRDLNFEIDMELIDLFFYHQANKRKRL